MCGARWGLQPCKAPGDQRWRCREMGEKEKEEEPRPRILRYETLVRLMRSLTDWLRVRGNVAAMCDAKHVKMKTCRACVSRLVIIGSGNYYHFPSASPCKSLFPLSDPHSWMCLYSSLPACVCVCVCVGYAEAQLRQYQRLTKQIKPDMENYERQREEWWDFISTHSTSERYTR